jgi:hypothetical protein
MLLVIFGHHDQEFKKKKKSKNQKLKWMKLKNQKLIKIFESIIKKEIKPEAKREALKRKWLNRKLE